MFKILRSSALSLLVLFGLNQQTHAQACSVKNLTVKVNSITSTANSCVINADITWIQDANSGNKFSNVHIWTSTNYPTTLIKYSKPATAAELANSLGTIVVNNPSSATPTLNNKYPVDNSVKMVGMSAATKIVRTANYPSAGLDSFRVSNVTLTLSGTNSCASSFILKGDVWSSQANTDQTVQCANANGTFTTTDVTIDGLIMCTNPRQFQLFVATASQTPVDFTYAVYEDVDNSGSYSVLDVLVGSGSGSTISTSRFTSPPVTYVGYPTRNLTIVVKVAGNPVAATGILTSGCALPVKYKNFEATRESSSLVNLKWTTTSEQNNTGFEIQRKDGNGSFRTIQFVNSKSKDGQSSIELNYTFRDQNVYEGMTQYRFVQVDFDGHRALSTIAVVSGKKGTGTTVLIYPNPSVNGNSTIVFNNSDQKDLYITDMSGRIIRTASNLSGNSYQLNGLKSGLYILKIINQHSNEIITEKISSR
ncbi:MAG TPA: T9SS type A sorting domain-containing protein [Flavitalea sp.]|nr:T9SS type A sorting domain-containing protein [Flavitalea sp.]